MTKALTTTGWEEDRRAINDALDWLFWCWIKRGWDPARLAGIARDYAEVLESIGRQPDVVRHIRRRRWRPTERDD